MYESKKGGNYGYDFIYKLMFGVSSFFVEQWLPLLYGGVRGCGVQARSDGTVM